MSESNGHDCVVCRCEDVKLGEILDAIHQAGAVSPQEVKMLTRAGKGMCGGRVCGNVVSRVVSTETRIPVDRLLWTRSRAPVRPTLLSEVADPSVDAIFDKSKAHVDLLSSAQHEKKS